MGGDCKIVISNAEQNIIGSRYSVRNIKETHSSQGLMLHRRMRRMDSDYEKVEKLIHKPHEFTRLIFSIH